MWYVLAIKSSQYKKIDTKLRALKVRRFYGMRTVWRKRRGGRRYRVDMPLFPAYLFVALSFKSTSARSILSIDGVTGFLGVGNVPQRIRDSEVKRMRDAQARGAYDETSIIIAQTLVGQTKVIQVGPFEGMPGVVKRVTPTQAELDVTIFGQTSTVKIDIDKLA
jgi:transcription antitermination factor NusG